jgi:hypothetical protein
MKKLTLLMMLYSSVFASVELQNKRLNVASDTLTKRYSANGISALNKPQSVNNLTKSEFETKDEFLDRKKQIEIENITYTTKVNKLKAKAQSKALGIILPSLYGKASVKKLTYIAETKSFIANVLFSKMAINDTVSISMPANEAKAFKGNFGKVKIVPVFGLEKSTIFLEKVKFIYNKKSYIGNFTNKYFKVSQPKLTLAHNYINIEEEHAKQQKEYMLANGLFEDDLEKMLKKTKKAKENGKKWALVIGVEKYRYSAKVTHAKRSAKLFSKVLNHTLGVPKNQTYTLMDDEASGTVIKTRIKQLLRHVKNGDTIYFYYNGHGVPVPSEKNEPYMLASDASIEYVHDDKFFALKNIYKTLTDSKADNVIAFVDSCFSGGTDGKAILKGVAAARLMPKHIGFNKKKMTLLTAGQGRQYSNGYDKKGHRLFSYFVMKNLIEGKRNMNTLYNSTYRDTKNTSYDLYGDLRIQEPTFDGNINISLD